MPVKMSDLKKKQENSITKDTVMKTLFSTSSELIKTAELWHSLKMIITESNKMDASSIKERIIVFYKTFLAMRIKLEDYETDPEIDNFLNNLNYLMNELKNVEFEEVAIKNEETMEDTRPKIEKFKNDGVELDDVQKMILENFNK